MNVVIVIQARMGSTRLPGKVLKKVDNKPLIEYQIERLLRVKNKSNIIIATTKSTVDDSIVAWCKQNNVIVYRGSEEDVLERYYYAALEMNADVVVRITADCPLIDPEVVEGIIDYYLAHDKTYDYVANCLQRTFPRGLDCEVFSFEALELAQQRAVEAHDREHVTRFMYQNQKLFRCANIAHGEDVSKYRWTVDTPEDFILIQNIIQNLYPRNPEFTYKDVLALFACYPSWKLINAHVEQKNE